MGSTLADSTQETTVNPAIWPSRMNTWVTLNAWPESWMENPTINRASNSAIINVVKISRPIGSLRFPPSASTFATSPRLDSDKIPAKASASVKCRLRANSMPRTSEVTASAARREMATDKVEATKNRPRIVDKKPGMSISSRPIRKRGQRRRSPGIIPIRAPAGLPR